MPSLLVQVLYGVYLGILTGIIPAVIAWVFGFSFKYITDVTVPGFAVVVLGVAIAGVNGGILALNDPTITDAPNSLALTVALLVVLLLSFYAHAKGDEMGAVFPRRLSLTAIRKRTLSTDVIELVGGRGQVQITVAGEVGDLEGYPPLPPTLRAEMSADSWTFPSDLPISEIENRLADSLRTEYDLTAVSVHINGQARASIEAAPPQAGVSKLVSRGKRGVSIDALLPTGIARGDVVTLLPVNGDENSEPSLLEGVVLSAHTYGDGKTADETAIEGDSPDSSVPRKAPTTDGGEGRLTIAVDRRDAKQLLRIERARPLVQPRGTRREFEFLSLLGRTGKHITRYELDQTSPITNMTLGSIQLGGTYGVLVLAIRTGGSWTVAPNSDTQLQSGDSLIISGGWDDIERFEEAAI